MRFTGLLAGTILLSSCWTPPELYSGPVQTLVSATTEVNKATAQELDSYMGNVRRDLVVARVSTAVLRGGERGASHASTIGTLSVEDFLCLPRWLYAERAAASAHLGAVSEVATSRLQDPSNDIGALLRALGTDYTLRIAASPGSEDRGAWIATNCRPDIEAADPFATRTEAPREAVQIGAAVAALTTFWDLIKPAAVAIGREVDRERRAAALRAYFADDRNVQLLQRSIGVVEEFLRQEFEVRRSLAAGRAVVAFERLRNPSSDAHRIDAALRDAACRGAPGQIGTNPERVACMEAALGRVETPLGTALTAASAYDRIAATKVPDQAERLSQQLGVVVRAARGQASTEEQLDAYRRALLRYVALAETIQKTASTENMNKARDAFENLRKALGGG
jgi:hypothetical protein